MKRLGTVLMSLRNPRAEGRRPPVFRHRPTALLAGLLLLGGCAERLGTQPAQPVAGPVAPPDPIAEFAGQARPGASATVPLPGGPPAAVRLVRSYHAASGRECREVAVGAGMAQRTQLVCKAEHGGWVSARPLLRGGTVRP